MTTLAAARLYLAQHQHCLEGKKMMIFNPHNKPVNELPVIYGFNNGGSPGWLKAVLLAENGKGLGSHICSDEGYMLHDLGILEGSANERHETFKKHYPNGYRMEFIPGAEVKNHVGLMAAYKLNQQIGAQNEV